MNNKGWYAIKPNQPKVLYGNKSHVKQICIWNAFEKIDEHSFFFIFISRT